MTWTYDEVASADGVRLRVGTMRAETPPSATCLLLQGRGDFLEAHEPAGQRLADLGMDVVSFDWRGQGASQRTAPPGVSDVTSFDRYHDDLTTVLAAFRKLETPLVLVAHSMAGLVATRYIAREPTAVTSAVLLSPMLAFRGAPPTPVVLGAAWLAARLGRADRLASGERAADPETMTLEDNMATSDPGAFRRLLALQLEHRDLVVAGSTWRWVAAATRAMREVARADLRAVRTDVLVASAPDDPSVDPAAHADLVARLPAARLRSYDARHDLLHASPSTVASLWSDITAHLARTLAVIA